MEIATIDSMCRCCAAEGIFKDIKTSYHWMGDEEVYGDMLRECFDVKLATVEEGGICEVCITQLRNAVNFKKQVLHTEKKFKKLLDNRRFKPTEVKEELSGDNGNSSDDNGGDSEDDEDYIPEFEIPIKTESPEESKSRKRAAKATTSRSKKSRVADDEDKSIASNDYNDLNNSIEMEVIELLEEPLEVASKVDGKPTTVQARNSQTTTKQPRKPNKTQIQTNFIKSPSLSIEKIKIIPTKVHAPAVQGIKIEPLVKQYSMQEIDKHRYNIRTILQYSNATPIRTHYIESGYSCCFCKSHFLKAANLKTHTIHDHDDKTKNKFMQQNICLATFKVKLDITSLNCNVCSENTDTLEQLIYHLNIAHKKGIYTDIKNQIMCFKLDGVVMKCHICSQEYHNFKLLQEHMNKHILNFICDECGAGFINRNQLKSHSDVHKKGTHKCDACDKIFNSSIRLKSHIRQTHTATLLHKCHLCNERFKTKTSKINHMKAHGVVYADLKCDACNRTFKTNNTLRLHIKRDHLMERRYKCEVCDREFCTADMLKDHEITHTGQRDFKCHVCSKLYAKKWALIEHFRSHTGDRRFRCTYCEMTFLLKSSLIGHLRSQHNTELQ